MSRAARHEFKNLFLASPTTIDGEVSNMTGVSFVSPADGEYLEVWQIDVDGRASNATATKVEFRDGDGGTVFRTVEVTPGDTKVITFGGLPKRIDTTLFIRTIGTVPEPANVTVHYLPKVSR